MRLQANLALAFLSLAVGLVHFAATRRLRQARPLFVAGALYTAVAVLSATALLHGVIDPVSTRNASPRFPALGAWYPVWPGLGVFGQQLRIASFCVSLPLAVFATRRCLMVVRDRRASSDRDAAARG